MSIVYCLAKSDKCKNRDLCIRYLPSDMKLPEKQNNEYISIIDVSDMISEAGQCEMQLIHAT